MYALVLGGKKRLIYTTMPKNDLVQEIIHNTSSTVLCSSLPLSPVNYSSFRWICIWTGTKKILAKDFIGMATATMGSQGAQPLNGVSGVRGGRKKGQLRRNFKDNQKYAPHFFLKAQACFTLPLTAPSCDRRKLRRQSSMQVMQRWKAHLCDNWAIC